MNIENVFVALRDFQIGVGSTVENPNPKMLQIKKGDILKWDFTAPNGYVWFYSEIPKGPFDYSHRGFIDMGSLENMIKEKYIKIAP